MKVIHSVMSSLKALFCDLCVILLFSLTGVLADDQPVDVLAPKLGGPKGNCTCGGFPTTTPDNVSSPVLSQSPGLVVNCDEEGQNTCKTLCNALAIATKAKGPEILCNKLKNTEELMLSAFYKVCDTPWSYADLTAETPLCCENNKVKACASSANLNATKMADAKTINKM